MPGSARGAFELERVTGLQRPLRPSSGVGRGDRGVEHAVGEQGVVGLLGGVVMIVGLLVGVWLAAEQNCGVSVSGNARGALVVDG